MDGQARARLPTDYSKNLSWRRWPTMILFMLYGLTSTFQNVQFVVKPELFSTYYNISINTVTWTSMVNMAVFIPLLIPTMILFDNIGLRAILLLGAGLNAVGAIIKCVAIQPDLFWIGTFRSSHNMLKFNVVVLK